LNSISAQAYRGRMSPLNNSLAPNPRLQRTRSAPLRSPLNRKPFGDIRSLGIGLACLVGFILSMSCVSVGGRLRPAWKKAFADTRCVVANADVDLVEVEAIVRDFWNSSLPGIQIVASRPRGSVAPISVRGSTEGSARFRLQPGLWRMTAALEGFHSATTQLWVVAREYCVVHFYLQPEHVAETW
jgi:hypothetical protein